MPHEIENRNIIERIRKYMSKEKLSVFVGAGVSKLSGYPSWYELV